MKKQLLLSLALLLCCARLFAQWQHIPGPDGGLVINLDTDGSLLYALTTTSIYRSDDEGYHWQVMEGSHHAGRAIGRLVVENGVFYGKNYDGEVLRSSDGGQTWQAVLKKPYPITAPGEVLYEVFAKGDTVLVSSAFTIYRSVDRGETWAATGDLFGYGHSNIFSAGPELMAWSGRNIHRSSDGGRSWKRVFSIATNFHAVGYANGYVFALYNNTNRVVRSKDGLRTWDVIDTDSINFSPQRPQILGDGKRTYYINRGQYCSGNYAYSDDRGLTWHSKVWEQAIPVSVRDIVSFDDHLVLAHRLGISHSTDQLETLTHEQSGLGASHVYSIFPGERNLAINAYPFAQISDNTGGQWRNLLPINADPCYGGPTIQGTRQRWFLTEEDGWVNLFSEDEGATWQQLPQPLKNLTASSENCLWEMEAYIRRWCDGETDPAQVSTDGVEYESLRAFGQHILAQTYDRHVIFDEQGQLVDRIPFSPCPLTGFGALSGYIHFDGHHLFHFCDQNTYIFKENATDWEEIYPQDWTTGIPLYHSRITAIATHQGVTWAALEGKGLFYTTDATGRFYPAQPQLPYPYPTAISFRDNTIWVGTDGGGIYHITLPPGQAEAAGKPTFQCSPNPSDGRLRLMADVFFTEEIPLEVLDVSGKSVASQILSPGRAWDLDFPNLPQGLYLLMLRTGVGTLGLKWVVY